MMQDQYRNQIEKMNYQFHVDFENLNKDSDFKLKTMDEKFNVFIAYK